MERQNTLLIGIGTDGCRIASAALKKSHRTDVKLLCLSVTQNCDIPGNGTYISLSHPQTFGELVQSFDDVPADDRFTDDNVQSVFDVRMDVCESNWRTKAAIAFTSMLNDEERRQAFHDALDEICSETSITDLSISYVISSVDYGIGAIIPVAFYIRNYFVKKFNISPKSEVYIAGPQLYKNSLSQYNYISVAAGAYAALRELKALFLSSSSSKNEQIAHSLDFKLGSEQYGMLGVLYDSSAPSAVLPFDNFILFENIMGASDSGRALDYISTVVSSLLNERSAPEYKKLHVLQNSAPYFSSHGIMKTVYPKQAICDYISKRYLTEEAILPCVTLYRKCVAALPPYRTTNDTTSSTESLLRTFSSVLNEEIDTDFSGEYYTEKLNGFITDIIPLELLTQADSFIASERKIPEQASPFKKTKLTYAFVSELHKKLTGLYNDIFSILPEKSIEAVNAVSKRDHPISLQTAIEKNSSDEYVPPMQAFFNLALAYSSISTAYANCTKDNYVRYNNDKPFELLPFDYLFLGKTKQSDDEYLALGRERFSSVAEHRKHIKFNSKTMQSVFDDAEKLKGNIIASAQAVILRSVLSVIIDTADRYLSLFNHFDNELKQYENDVYLSVQSCSASSYDTINVFASPEDKMIAYDSFKRSVDSHTVENCIYHTIADRLALLTSDSENEPDLFGKLSDASVTALKKSDFYALHLNRSITDVIFSPDDAVCRSNKSSTHTYVNLAFHTASLPINAKLKDSETGEKTADIFTTLILPQGIRNELSSKGLLNHKEAITEAFSSNGAIPDTIVFSDIEDISCMYVRKTVKYLPLEHIDFYNECIGEGVKLCAEAISLYELYNSPMWYPYLKPFHHTNGHLPYISPDMRALQEENAAKAFLHAVLSNAVFTLQGDSGNDICYMRGETKPLPLKYMDNDISYGDHITLFKWLLANDKISDLWSEEFCKAVRSEAVSAPVTANSESSVNRTNDYFHICRFLSLLCTEALPLAFELNDKYYAELLIRLAHRTLLDYCTASFPISSDGCYSLYVYNVSRFTDAFEQRYTDQFSNRHKSISELFNAHRIFFEQDK